MRPTLGGQCADSAAPVSTVLPAIMAWWQPGAAWFHHQLVPDGSAVPATADARTTMAIWQLGNCASFAPLHAAGGPALK